MTDNAYHLIRTRIRPALTLRCLLAAVLMSALFIPVSLNSAFAAPTSAEKQAEADEVSARLAASEAQMVQMRDQYWAALQEHDAAVAAMQEAQTRIDAAQSVIGQTQERLGARATQMYRQGPLSFLDVLFGASSFEEFTTSWDYINSINAQNATLIQTNKNARAEAEEAHEEFSAQEVIAAERLVEAEAIKVRAEEIVAAQAVELAALETEVANLVQKEQEERLAEEARRELERNPPAPSVNYNPPPDIPSGGYSSVVAAAASRLGCPYVWAASGPDYFDCSGLTSWCYAQAGLGYIGRTDSAQYGNASSRWPYSEGGAAPGDVLWWPGHVAIYAGGGSYIHAPVPGDVVSYSSWNIGSAVVLRF